MPGNSFGTAFRYTTWGESHGPAIGCVIDGVPPRIPITVSEIQVYLDKRRPGGSRFTSQRREADQVRILAGVFEGQTTGTPLALAIENTPAISRARARTAAFNLEAKLATPLAEQFVGAGSGRPKHLHGTAVTAVVDTGEEHRTELHQ